MQTVLSSEEVASISVSTAENATQVAPSEWASNVWVIDSSASNPFQVH